MTQAQVSYTDSCPLVLRYPVSGSLESVRLSSDVRERLIVECVMYFSIIDFLLWLFTMSCIIHISMAVCSTMIQSMIVLSTCHLATSSGLKLSDGCNHRPDRSF